MVETIQQASKHTPPKSVKDCVKQDPISVMLWGWAENVAKWGRILLILLLIPGVIEIVEILSKQSPAPEVLAMQGIAAENKLMLIIGVVLNSAITAFITYLTYNVISLLIASLASIVQNTRSNALLKEYELLGKAVSEDTVTTAKSSVKPAAVPKAKVVSSSAEWSCPKCGRKNPAGSSTCSLCGVAYSPRTNEEVAKVYDEIWSCPKCGRKNASDTDICSLCGNHR